MDIRVDEYLRESILNKCKVTLACRFQGSNDVMLDMSDYELAYIVEKLKELKND